MSDVFVSYAREDRPLAQALAQDLERRGYRVWWDAELVGSDNFYDVILAALVKARAAVVIWTKDSCKSNFVRDEARYALHHKKLVAVKSPGLEVLDIPFGFQGQHTEYIDNREQIVKALTKLGVAPVAAAATTAGTWDSVKDTQDIDELLAWLERNPTHEHRQAAFQRVRQLVRSEEVTAVKDRPAPIKRRGNLAAFFAGLAFRLPSFQLSAEGKWSSIGFSIGLVFLLIVLVSSAVILIGNIEMGFQGAGWKAEEFVWITSLLGSAIMLLLTWIARARFLNCVDQRNFFAAWIIAPVLALLCGLFFSAAGIFLLAVGGNIGPAAYPYGKERAIGNIRFGDNFCNRLHVAQGARCPLMDSFCGRDQGVPFALRQRLAVCLGDEGARRNGHDERRAHRGRIHRLVKRRRVPAIL